MIDWDGKERRKIGRDTEKIKLEIFMALKSYGLDNFNVRMDGVEDSIKRLDDRINGAFEHVGEHIKESEGPTGYRERVIRLEEIITTLAKEKLNSVKASQWRIGLIAGMPGAILAILKILEMLSKGAN